MNYPKWLFHATKPAVVVDDEAGEQDLGLGWFSTPAEAADSIDSDTALEAQRQALLDKAAELGIQLHHRTGIDKAQAAIDDHLAIQAAQAAPETPTNAAPAVEPTTAQE